MGKIEELIEKYKQDKLMARGFIVDDLGAVYKEINEVIEDLQQLKSSLPTQQDKVVVKQYIADWYEEHKHDTLETKFRRAQVDKDERVRKWYYNCQGRHANKRANAQEVIAKMNLNGYTVEKEQLYYVKVGNLVFVDWEDSFVAKLATTDSPEWTGHAHKIPTKDGADNIARIVGGEVVPVEEEE